ncbi:biotin--[acetyl-CoA-carboxylase] ligase [Amycolatopsis nigrescens]|uniref:biotin--[acetyl-CoA-carboxylase] ligase n=1 Tax=Amycolatopsis nigrescens TaxID=381445 RepID=UPI000366C68C|nr:biotin--[acetyl-CoA-carboxylase] ligase [Amycolatopsis nigrescens]
MTEIDGTRLRAELEAPAGPYDNVKVVASTGSTNADLRAAAADGAADRTVLIAAEQTAGVGRRARHWSSPKDAGIYVSLLLRPREVSFADVGSLSIVAGLAVMDLAAELGVYAVLKWPNDVLAGPDARKCAGILSEAVASEELAVVLGIGLNLRPSREHVPPGPGGLPATSLGEEGAKTTDRTAVSALLLAALADREARWRAGGGNLAKAGMLDDYRKHCATLGQQVKIMLPDGGQLHGTAADVDSSGQLLLVGQDGRPRTIFAGDVVHLRTADQ